MKRINLQSVIRHGSHLAAGPTYRRAIRARLKLRIQRLIGRNRDEGWVYGLLDAPRSPYNFANSLPKGRSGVCRPYFCRERHE